MQIIVDGDLYKVVRITGPQHNFLGIRLGDVGEVVEIEALPFTAGVARVSSDSVFSQVLLGLEEANLEIGKKYAISKIYYVPTDTPSETSYKQMISALIKRIDSEGL